MILTDLFPNMWQGMPQRKIIPDFHQHFAFTFTPEGRKGEQQVIDFINEKLDIV